jgi:ribosomal-protein-alanine N-acetyltransferase
MQDWVKPVTLEGRVVRLEPLHPRHASGLLAAATPDLFEFTPQNPREYSVAGFLEDIEKVNAIPDSLAFAIIHRASGEVAGRTTYMEIRPVHRGLEIGRTWIARTHQGTHLNPEMKLLMMRHAFGTLGAIRVQYKTGHRNLHSQRAIAKLGAIREGELRNHQIEPDGRVRNTVVFSITREEWPVIERGLEARLTASSNPK